MDKRLSLKIARRMNMLLTESLDEGVLPQRMLDDHLYARDVLLVCDAMHDTELPKLARIFRQAQLDMAYPVMSHAPLSISGMLNSIFGGTAPSADADNPHPAGRTGLRRWLGSGMGQARDAASNGSQKVS